MPELGLGQRVRVRAPTGQVGTFVVGDPNSFVPDAPKPPSRTSPFRLLDKATKIASQFKSFPPSLLDLGRAAAQATPEPFLEPVGQIAGSLIGGAVGAPGGFPGIVAGRAIGAGTGTVVARGELLRRRQVRGEDISVGQAVKELGTSGGIAAGVEALFPLANRALGISRGASAFFKKNVQPAFETLLEFFTDIPQAATKHIFKRGTRILTSRPLRSEERGARLAERLLNTVQSVERALGKRWDEVVTPLRRNPTKIIGGEDLAGLRSEIQQTFTDFNVRKQPLLSAAKDRFKLIRKTQTDVERLLSSDTLSLDNAISLRQQLDDMLFSKQGRELFTSSDHAALGRLRESIGKAIHRTFPEVQKVDESFSTLRNASRLLEGIDPRDPRDVQRVTNIIDDFFKQGIKVKEAVIQADEVLGANGALRSLPDILDRAAAMQFAPVTFRGIRSAVAGTLVKGAGLGAIVGGATGGKEGLIPGAVFGAMLSTPRSAGFLLRGAIGIGKAGQATGRALAPPLRAGFAEMIRRRQLSPQAETPATPQ